ncbi:MAG: Txe/YoeB family addiction module toxin [Synergistaceae bacterium]|jgi:toxin YoeB|nr:Txe/YoeB family addiction module toxin [Synergistaceae bacterium]
MHKTLDFTGDSWEDYLYWQTQDRKTLNGYEEIGHTEPLSGDLAGYWSRHIDDSNRLVYRLRDDVIELYELRTHYGDK